MTQGQWWAIFLALCVAAGVAGWFAQPRFARALYSDFAFIPAYTLLFTFTSWTALRWLASDGAAASPRTVWRLMAPLLIVYVAGALIDVTENVILLGFLRGPAWERVRSIATVLKWVAPAIAAIYFATGLVVRFVIPGHLTS